MRKFKLLLFVGMLVLAVLACDFSLSDIIPEDGVPDPGDIATAVALTLEASGIPAPPLDTPADTPVDPPPPPAPAVLRVAYVDGDDLWLWTEGSGALEIYDHPTSSVSDVRISDDGLLVAFTLADNSNFIGIWAVNSDGSSPRELVNAATVTAMGTNPSAAGTRPYRWDFIPGSHTLAFNTRQFYEGPGLDIQDDLRLLNADTAALSTLLAPGSAGQFYYSPDGSQIALTTPTSISLINADGSNLRVNVLTYTSIITYSEYQWYAIPRWAPDSSHLRVAIPSADILDPAATVAVWHIPTDGSAASSLGSTASTGTHYNQESTISPDLTELVFLRQFGAPTDNAWEIRFLDLSTFVDNFYNSGGLSFETWAPDSIKFVYKVNPHLFVGQQGVGGVIALPDTGNGMNPVFVDANRVLYLSGGGPGIWELRMQTIGGGLLVIASPIGDSLAFDFSN